MPLNNNHDEQQVRPTTIGRKNYLFTKSEVGAKANAMWYSIIQTAKLNKLIKMVCYAVFTFERTIKNNKMGV